MRVKAPTFFRLFSIGFHRWLEIIESIWSSTFWRNESKTGEPNFTTLQSLSTETDFLLPSKWDFLENSKIAANGCNVEAVL